MKSPSLPLIGQRTQVSIEILGSQRGLGFRVSQHASRLHAIILTKASKTVNHEALWGKSTPIFLSAKGFYFPSQCKPKPSSITL
jgi:hypothetical protein